MSLRKILPSWPGHHDRDVYSLTFQQLQLDIISSELNVWGMYLDGDSFKMQGDVSIFPKTETVDKKN